MKRNPRWMVMAVAVALMAMSCWDASAGPLPSIHWLPNDPPTIGEPDGGGGGKNSRTTPGDYVLVSIAGSAWTMRLYLGSGFIRILPIRFRLERASQLNSHD
jgi:hypothetical protein